MLFSWYFSVWFAFFSKLRGLVGASTNKIICSYTPAIRSLLLNMRNTSVFQFSILTEIAAVDRPQQALRFSLTYVLRSIITTSVIAVRVIGSATTLFPSLTPLWFGNRCLFPSANWLEREVWDLFGIRFAQHPDLRRSMTDYGFSGHPLQKDFPLTGYVEIFYASSSSSVVTEPVELSQESKLFNNYNIARTSI